MDTVMTTANQPNNQSSSFDNAPINWIPAFVLVSTPILALFLVPYYLWTHDVTWQVWAVFAFCLAWSGLSITTGYHRLWSHRAYQTHPVLKWFWLIGGTFAVQSSVFDWCSGHRTHHRHVDDVEQDPYSVKRGFWFSHIGWMLKNYPSGNFDYKNIPDLTTDPILQIQHKYYGFWVLLTNIGIPLLFGWLVGDIAGTMILAGLLRLVISHHCTFFINSLCHMFGTRPYTDTNTARDNPILALFTWGEGYHNYHHYFQYDYRNGVKWWQYDPTKWIIYGLSKVGLAWDLKRVPDVAIQHAQVEMKFKTAQNHIDGFTGNLTTDLQLFKERIVNEQQAFKQTISEWQALKAQAIEMKKNEFAQRLHEVDEKLKDQMQAIEQKMQQHAKQLEQALASLQGKMA